MDLEMNCVNLPESGIRESAEEVDIVELPLVREAEELLRGE